MANADIGGAAGDSGGFVENAVNKPGVEGPMSTPGGTAPTETLSVGDVAGGGTSGGGTSGGGASPTATPTAAPSEIKLPDVQTTANTGGGTVSGGGSSPVGSVGDGFDEATAEYMKYRSSPEGILNRAWGATKDFAGSSLGKEVIAGGIKQVGGYIMGGGSDMQEFEQQLKEAQVKYYEAGARNVNANASATEAKTAYGNMVPVALDPSDPLYAQKKASAEASGFKTFDIATPAKGPITRAPIQNQYTAPISTAR